MKIDRTRLALALLLVTAIFLVLTFFFWDYVRETVAIPIYYVLWVTDLLLKSIPQQLYLLLLVGLCLIIAITTLADLGLRRNPTTKERIDPAPFTRYRLWSNFASNLYTSTFSREQFVIEMRKLVLAILAHEEGVTSDEVAALIAAGNLAVPDPVKDLVIQRNLVAFNDQADRQGGSILARLGKFLRARGVGGVASSSNRSGRFRNVDSQVAEIVGFIEDHLEITHAGNQP